MSESQVDYLTLAEAQYAHEVGMKRSGHEPTPLLFPERLESALLRPRNLAYYTSADLIAQVAALIIAISESQAFQEGNKRTALVAGETMLMINGYEYSGDSELLAVRIAELASPGERGSMPLEAVEELASYMRPDVVPLRNISHE